MPSLLFTQTVPGILSAPPLLFKDISRAANLCPELPRITGFRTQRLGDTASASAVAQKNLEKQRVFLVKKWTWTAFDPGSRVSPPRWRHLSKVGNMFIPHVGSTSVCPWKYDLHFYASVIELQRQIRIMSSQPLSHPSLVVDLGHNPMPAVNPPKKKNIYIYSNYINCLYNPEYLLKKTPQLKKHHVRNPYTCF